MLGWAGQTNHSYLYSTQQHIPIISHFSAASPVSEVAGQLKSRRLAAWAYDATETAFHCGYAPAVRRPKRRHLPLARVIVQTLTSKPLPGGW